MQESPFYELMMQRGTEPQTFSDLKRPLEFRRNDMFIETRSSRI